MTPASIRSRNAPVSTRTFDLLSLTTVMVLGVHAQHLPWWLGAMLLVLLAARWWQRRQHGARNQHRRSASRRRRGR